MAHYLGVLSTSLQSLLDDLPVLTVIPTTVKRQRSDFYGFAHFSRLFVHSFMPSFQPYMK